MLVNTLNVEYMNDKQASGFFKSLFQFLDESEKKSLSMLKKTHKHIRPIVLRFVTKLKRIQDLEIFSIFSLSKGLALDSSVFGTNFARPKNIRAPLWGHLLPLLLRHCTTLSFVTMNKKYYYVQNLHIFSSVNDRHIL